MLEILKLARRYLWLIILTTVISCVAAFYGTRLITPIYTAKSLVRVLSVNEGQISSPLFDTLYSSQLLNTYALVGMSQDILDDLTSILALDSVPDIVIDVLKNTELLRITVRHENPEIVAASANTLAELLVANSTELVSGQGPSSSD